MGGCHQKQPYFPKQRNFRDLPSIRWREHVLTWITLFSYCRGFAMAWNFEAVHFCTFVDLHVYVHWNASFGCRQLLTLNAPMGWKPICQWILPVLSGYLCSCKHVVFKRVWIYVNSYKYIEEPLRTDMFWKQTICINMWYLSTYMYTQPSFKLHMDGPTDALVIVTMQRPRMPPWWMPFATPETWSFSWFMIWF